MSQNWLISIMYELANCESSALSRLFKQAKEIWRYNQLTGVIHCWLNVHSECP